jgi:heptosyltransferase-2
VLAVRFSSIGDILLTTPLYRALKARHPGAHLTVVTKPAFAPLLEGNPRVDRVLTLGRGGSLTALAATLRSERFTHCLELHGSLRSATLRRLVPGRWRGYRKRAAARWALIHLKRDWYRDAVPVAERYFEAARDLDLHPDGGPPEFFVPAAADAAMAAWLDETGVPRRFVTLAPGAAHATKRWPLDRWVALARGLAAAGLGVVAVGGPDDADLAATVAAAAGPAGTNAAGRTSLPETAALLRRSAATVAGDTGVMHLATAVTTPVVALFGPTVRQFGFFPYTDRATVVERELACRPCSAHGGDRCPLGHHDCLRTIAVAEVRAALDRWLR